MLEAVWKRRVLRCRLNVEKVCESRMVFSREFQTVGAHTRKARELKTSFVRETVRRLVEVERRSLNGWMEHVVSRDRMNMMEYW